MHSPQARPRLERALHPGAWWLWVIGLALAASRTTNPILLGLIIAVVAVVVSARRTDAAWSRGFGAYLAMGLVIVAIRVVFRAILGGDDSGDVLFTLPQIPLPESAAGIKLGGPVTSTDVLASLYQGARLATIIICIGAANVLADPKRLLRLFPGALYELGTALTVTVTVAPQLVESGIRVRRARRLRGDAGGRRHLIADVALPVMVDALDRSLILAAAMDSRGYGRSAAVPKSRRRLSGAMVLIGVLGVMVGTYGALDGTAPAATGIPLLLVALLVAVVGVGWGAQQVQRTRYRPDPWETPEWLVSAAGCAVAVGFMWMSGDDSFGLVPSVDPASWPALSIVAVAIVALGLGPAFAAPPPPSRGVVERVDHLQGGAE